jgi:predicted phosphoadenosine phosphosulfate sulfurtransferase
VATRVRTGRNVFDESLARLESLYREGHRLVISFSGGKDSGVLLEMAILAARHTGCLPVEVVMRDEEVMFPGTYEYAERVANRKEVNFHWLVANQPIVNVYNRPQPYFWTFDPLLPPSDWVRQPPNYAQHIDSLNIEHMTIPERFPPPEGKSLMAVIGMRASESRGRMYGVFSAKSYVLKPNEQGVRNVWAIYDWSDGDIWRAIQENKWDYNSAYDVLVRMGVERKNLRIAPPTLNIYGANLLQVAARAFPRWFDKVCERLPGVRQVALFGLRAVTPHRRLNESWEECFKRECITDAPAQWIRERAERFSNELLERHAHHSKEPLPQVNNCFTCGYMGSWKSLAMALYNGDPFSLKARSLPYVEPEFFRKGAGTWNGSPQF